MTAPRIIYDDKAARAVIDQALANSKDLGPVMLAIAGELDDRVQEAFEYKRDPFDLSGWAELRPATVKDRLRKGYNATDTLQRTGILRASVVTEQDGNAVEVSTGGVEYALVHFYGSSKKNIPARRFAGFSLDDLAEFEDWLAEFIAGA